MVMWTNGAVASYVDLVVSGRYQNKPKIYY